jgi:hypothetical protein
MKRLSASRFGFHPTEVSSGQHKLFMVCSLAIALTVGPALNAEPPESETDATAEAEVVETEDPSDARSVSVAENTLTVPMPESASERMRYLDGGTWHWTGCAWTAPDTYSNPRYFEDVMLERHGHERWGYSQSLFSGARFFATAPMLPYLMAIQHPCHCESTLGYHRSGSCTPAFFQRPPFDRKAVVAQSATMATGLWIFP